MSPVPGEVWTADLGLAAKFQPVVIVSRQDADPPRALVIYVPITSQNRGSKYEVILPKVRFLDEGSVANVQGIGSVPNVRLGRKLGRFARSGYEPNSKRRFVGRWSWIPGACRRVRRTTVGITLRRDAIRQIIVSYQ